MKKTILVIIGMFFTYCLAFAIDAPLNTSPVDGTNNLGVQVTLDWSAITGNSGYIYQLDTVDTFDSPLFSDGNSSINSSQISVSNLYFGTTYYWRAATKTAVDTSIWSPTTSFTTSSGLTNTTPSNGAINQAVQKNLDWSAIGGNNGYIYQFDTVNSFDSPLLLEGNSAINSSNTNVYNLYFGTTYYWRAAAISLVDTSEWSSTWNFTTIDYVSNILPSNGALNQNVSLNIDWDAVSGNTGYIYKFDTTLDFNSSLLYEGTSAINSSNADINNLLFGTTYYWKAAVKNLADTSNWSTVWSFTTKDYVSLVTPTDGAINQNVYLELDWTALAGSNSYQVELDTIASFNSPEYRIDDSFNSYFYETELLFGTEYFWRVRACHANDTSEWSVIRSFTTRDNLILVSPSDNATNQNVYLELDWATLTGSNSYQVELDTMSSFNSTEYRIDDSFNSYFYETNLFYGTEYFWRVRACHVNDTSEWSVIRSFTTRDNLVLVSPSDNVTNQNVYLELDWASLSGSSSYQVELDTILSFDSPEYCIDNSFNSYFYETDLFYGTKYFWRVRACHINDTSEWSVIRNFTTVDQIYLTSPSNGSTNISVTPVLNYSSSTGSLGYLCEVDTSMNFNSDVYQLLESSTGTSQVNASGLLYGTTYYWRAATRNAVDTSKWSTVWTFTTAYELTEAPILISPADETVDIPFTSTTVDWNSSTGAVTYQYQCSTDPSFEFVLYSHSTSLINGTFSGLYPHTTYYWRVRGANTNGYSPWSEVWEFMTESADLTPPVLLSPSNNAIEVSPDNVTIDWNSVYGASGYTYEFTDDENFISGIITQLVAETEKEILGLADGTQYFWRVKSTDGAVESDWSEVWNFTTEYSFLNAPILISPSDNSIDLNFASTTIDWNAVIGASSYIYEYSIDETFASNVVSDIITGIEFEITGLEPNTEYFWRIQATNGVIYSAWSNEWSFKTIIDGLDTPILVSPTDNSTNLDFNLVTIDWSIVLDASGYVYEYSTDETFATNTVSGAISPSNYDIIDLLPATQYFWRIKATYGSIESLWTDVWNFTTETDISAISEIISDLSVYPNPSNGEFYVDGRGITKLEVMDITGRLVYSQNINMSRIIINISDCKPGMYLLRIYSDDDFKTVNIIVE